MKKTTEQMAADALLQKPKAESIGGVTYEVAPPSLTAIVQVSALASQIPSFDTAPEDFVLKTIKHAKDWSIVGEIAATLILGPKEMFKEREIEKRYCFGLIKRRSKITVDLKKELAQDILCERPSRVAELIHGLLKQGEISHFFGLTASLVEANLLKPTAEAETTASGQS